LAGKQLQHLAENAGYSYHGSGGPSCDSRLSTQTVAEFYRRRSTPNLDKSEAYQNITPDELRAAIDEAHRKNLKITGHLCSVGFTEAADLGIDNLEHGILVDEEFYPAKDRAICPDLAKAAEFFNAELAVGSPQVHAMIHHLVERNVAVTSTLAVDEDFAGHSQPLSEMENREHWALGWRSWLMYRMIRSHFEKQPITHLLEKEMCWRHPSAVLPASP
jgi:hypothetical protein